MTISSNTTLRSKTTAILSLLIYLQFILFFFRHYASAFINKSYLSDVVDIKHELFSLSLLVCCPSSCRAEICCLLSFALSFSFFCAGRWQDNANNASVVNGLPTFDNLFL